LGSFNVSWGVVEVEGTRKRGLEVKLGVYGRKQRLSMVWREKVVGIALIVVWDRCVRWKGGLGEVG
jgi:hypothetical protein